MMKKRHLNVTSLPILLVCPLIPCLALLAGLFWLHGLDWTLVQAKAAVVEQALPAVDKSVLVVGLAGRGDGGTQGCLAFLNLQVYANNDMTLSQVLDFYSAKLPLNGWKQWEIGNDWRSFWFGDKESVLSVGEQDDFNLNYELLMLSHPDYDANRTKVSTAKTRYKTIYFVEVITYDLNPVARKQCQEF